MGRGIAWSVLTASVMPVLQDGHYPIQLASVIIPRGLAAYAAGSYSVFVGQGVGLGGPLDE